MRHWLPAALSHTILLHLNSGNTAHAADSRQSLELIQLQIWYLPFHPLPLCIAGYACAAIPANCGTTPNSPCCPSSYHTAFNPPLRKSQCAEDYFCEFDSPLATKYPGSDLLSGSPGVCLPNAPGCGEVGKPCCISNGWSSTSITCLAGPRPAGKGPEGYCVTADGKAWGEGVMLKGLMCKRCPQDVESLKQSQPVVYEECT
jgi:hypothetical protein